MLTITPNIAIDEREIFESFVRASGPGGQNVNKVATAVQLQFDARRTRALNEAARERLIRLAGSRASAEGVITIEARRHRTQEQNREDARERLAELIRRALEPPKPRRATKVSRAERERRLESKKHRGQTKALRRANERE